MSTKQQQQYGKRKNGRNNSNGVTKVVDKSMNKKKKQKQSSGDCALRIQDDLLSPDYILRKVFRKDGPPIGSEFDSLPSHAFRLCKGKGSRKSHRACQENQRALKRRKVSKPTALDDQISTQSSAPVTRHGMGKGLMTVWRLTHPKGGDFPAGVDPRQRVTSRKPPVQGKKKKACRQSVTRRAVLKVQDKNKSTARSRKVSCPIVQKQKLLQKEKCELALESGRWEENLDQFSMLLDDEELELREQQTGPNPLTCSAHFATNGLHGCSLCKDLLAKFPPNSVKMNQPLHLQPWDSSPDLVKKLVKVFHFLCTYAATICISSFTLDELAQSFHDKDSLLLGKINVALLDLLLSDIGTELSSRLPSFASRNCKYSGLLHFVKHQDSIFKSWKEFLNPLTWTELLRQVLVAAGFGSKYGTSPKEPLRKEVNPMKKYGLSPGTLKGELFTILLLRGNIGMKVSELADASSITNLKLAATSGEVELLISSMLSSDITLFEKISPSAYRLRINTIVDSENDQSDNDDYGSVDDDKDSSKYISADDSDISSPSKLSRSKQYKSRNSMLTVYNEIDESHPGEVWLLGLMEGEYSDLNIEEKLNSLEALMDLLSAGSSIRVEEPVTSIVPYVPSFNHIGSGAKIKRSTHHSLPMTIGSNSGQVNSISEENTHMQPVDSVAYVLKMKNKYSNSKKDAKEIKVVHDLHPMQSIFLGSDRRYNRYWLFLGPCDVHDPGHRRIYFESSDDGHWEVIDMEEALCTLLSSLDRRGRRESHLLSSLEKSEIFLCRAMSMTKDAEIGQPTLSDESGLSFSREDSSSAVSDVDNLLGFNEMQKDLTDNTGAIISQTEKKVELQKQKWSRLQAFDAWIWNSFYRALNAVKHGRRTYLDSLSRCERCHDLYWKDEKHCKICHTTFEIDFDLEERYAIHAATCRESSDLNIFPKHKVLSSQLQALKAAIYSVESSMPEGSMVGIWMKSAHNLWVKRLRRTSTLVEFLQVVNDFVGAINEEWLCQRDISFGSKSATEEIILRFHDVPQTSSSFGSKSATEEIILRFHDVPQTSSAVALWLVKLDALIGPHLEKAILEKRTTLATRSKGKHVPSQ